MYITIYMIICVLVYITFFSCKIRKKILRKTCVLRIFFQENCAIYRMFVVIRPVKRKRNSREDLF